ncbi:MAG TPA: hypothetical protein VM115_11745, partial [Vicinamibacterales bacterium]|nr:hypothetical protein [Vicinamibacterales bacterium]
MSAADLIRLLGALATLIALGYGLTNFLAGDLPLYRTERLAIAYVLGTGAASVTWFLLTPLYAVVSPTVALTAIAWIVAAAALVKRAKLPPLPHSEPRQWWLIPVAAVVLLQVAVLAYAAMHSDLGFDAVFNFELKARVAFE